MWALIGLIGCILGHLVWEFGVSLSLNQPLKLTTILKVGPVDQALYLFYQFIIFIWFASIYGLLHET